MLATQSMAPAIERRKQKWPVPIHHPTVKFPTVGQFEEDQAYFWRKAGKALKSHGKPEKNTENVAGNWKMPFCSLGKLKKTLRKAGKSLFFLRKAGNRPPIPGPQIRTGFNNRYLVYFKVILIMLIEYTTCIVTRVDAYVVFSHCSWASNLLHAGDLLHITPANMSNRERTCWPFVTMHTFISCISNYRWCSMADRQMDRKWKHLIYFLQVLLVTTQRWLPAITH